MNVIGRMSAMVFVFVLAILMGADSVQRQSWREMVVAVVLMIAALAIIYNVLQLAKQRGSNG